NLQCGGSREPSLCPMASAADGESLGAASAHAVPICGLPHVHEQTSLSLRLNARTRARRRRELSDVEVLRPVCGCEWPRHTRPFHWLSWSLMLENPYDRSNFSNWGVLTRHCSRVKMILHKFCNKPVPLENIVKLTIVLGTETWKSQSPAICTGAPLALAVSR